MRRILTLLLMGATFLGGYHLGRQPNSPDVVGWAQANAPRVAEAGREVAAALTARTGETPPEACDAAWRQR